MDSKEDQSKQETSPGSEMALSGTRSLAELD
jgi:hypothetical protein